MNGATLATELRSFTGTTSTNYSDTLAFIDLNKSYHYIEDCITEIVGESYFYNEMAFATVVNQKEYTMPASVVSNLDGTNKHLGVSINYGQGLVKLTKKDMSALDHDIGWYSTHQPTTDPFFLIQDNSIMIFPSPTAIGSGIQYIIQNLIDIDASTTEGNIFNGKIHKKYHPLIALGAENYCYQRRQLQNKAQESDNRFNIALFGGYIGGKYAPGMLDLINTRNRGARIRQMPDGYSVKQ